MQSLILLAGALFLSGSTQVNAQTTTESPQLIFGSLQQQLTCTPLRISWIFSGPQQYNIDIQITTDNVPQVAPPSVSSTAPTTTSNAVTNTFTDTGVGTLITGGLTGRGVPLPSPNLAAAKRTLQKRVNTQITASVPASQELFVYEKLDVPAGWYELTASTPGGEISKSSAAFYVWNGTDTSCIPGQPQPSPSGSGVSSASAPAASASESAGVPVGGSSSSKSQVNAGAIAGGVIGGVALVLIFGALFWLCSKRQSKSRSRTAITGYGDEAGGAGAGRTSAAGSAGRSSHKRRKWGGLSSVDSIAAAAGSATSERKPMSSTSPREKPLTPNRRELPTGAAGAGAVALSERRPSQPTSEFNPYSEEDEKASTSSPTSPFDNSEEAMAAGYAGYTGLDYRNNSPTRSPGVVRVSTASSASGGAIPNYSRPLSSPPTSVSGHELQQGSPGKSSVISEGDSIVSPEPSTNAKPKRKPVPSYVPSTISPESIGEVVPSHQPMPSPMPAPTPSPGTSPPASALGHYAVGKSPSAPPPPPGLAHKDSYGKDGQVHYLMPDMPSSEYR